MPRSSYRLLLLWPLLSLLATGCARVETGDEEFRGEAELGERVGPSDVARGVIDARDVRSHIGYLASDGMRGRAAPSPELDRAAAWIAERFAAAGLAPAGEHGGYAQFWRHRRADSTRHVPNVIGVLDGSDGARAGEYVILTASFDHLGVGQPNEDEDSIYNGADDNASGVAALLEVAEAFGAMPKRPARPVLFLATSGTEHDFRGAHLFVDSPTVFLSEAVAVFDLARLGHNSPDSVAVRARSGGLDSLLTRIARHTERLRLSVRGTSTIDHDGRPDHPLMGLDIPSVTVTAGPHETHGTPADEADDVDADKIARIARLVFLAAHELAAAP